MTSHLNIQKYYGNNFTAHCKDMLIHVTYLVTLLALLLLSIFAQEVSDSIQ